jgi:cholesterol oxidase
MSIDPVTVDLGSLSALLAAFRAAPEPILEELVGEHAAEFVGPRLLRSVAPTGLRILGMPGWCGKRFDPDPGDGVLHGANRARDGQAGVVVDSIPITARVAPSRLDGRAALAVTYPADARFPWPWVVDELRPFGSDALVGMTIWIRGVPRVTTPFLLRRVAG